MLTSFALYCEAHPHERFWQALRNWARESIDNDINFILVGNSEWLHEHGFNNNAQDTFYWENDKLNSNG